MALKALLAPAEFEKLPEALKSAYTKSGEGDDVEYVLDVDEKPFRKRIDEFRTNNNALKEKQKELEEHAAELKDVDPKKYREVLKQLEEVDKLEERDLIKQGKLDEVIGRRTAGMQTEHKNQLTAKDKALVDSTNKNKMLTSRLGTLLIDSEAQNTLNRLGVEVVKGALPDILSRAHRTFSINDAGELVPAGPDGKINYGSDSEPLGFEEWGKKLVEEAAHLFQPSSGGGAGGGDKTKQRSADGAKVIDGTNAVQFGRHVKDIAAGKVKAPPRSQVKE